eukprot:5185530-Pyramimonas_sp.AAC.1
MVIITRTPGYRPGAQTRTPGWRPAHLDTGPGFEPARPGTGPGFKPMRIQIQTRDSDRTSGYWPGIQTWHTAA